ncbi:MAG: cupin domain-containing protein, partial [Proteobacteria bacterium]
MKKVKDTLVSFPGLVIIHQKIAAYETGRHSHEEHEFFLPMQGQITVNHPAGTVKAGPGKMLYVPPGMEHDFTSSAEGSGERLIWMVEPRLWQRQVKVAFDPVAMPVNNLAKELLFYLLVNGGGAGRTYFISALLEALKQSLESASLTERKVRLDVAGAKAADPRLQKALGILR